ncbi:hypothetical protein HO173_000567 [Letharia columbiana]|uniref:CRIB domain-containing protein n=1 Tax=Letharia columbiana TaxID=112416 RepID=A0A8H6LB01_9LECA|nr:uncharacterized protein HO173_000567 [Letharia columbiana]KAF6241855.1 hypothetical protein HO173_000567 [Letharia columbiana]
MFEFKGTAADSTEGSRLDWRVVDHKGIQDLGRRPFTTMLQPAHHQRAKTEGARRPSLQLRSRSNSSAPNYSRPQDRDDLSPVSTSIDRRTPRTSVDRRSVAGGSTHTRGDALDSFAPKAWMAKGSRFLKRQNSKHELTSLRTLDWVEESKEARVHHVLDQPPSPDFMHSRTPSTGDPNAALRLNISEPFNFHHVTHTQPHHVQQLERANPNDLVSEFSALRASQASQPGLRGIKAKDIQREDLPRDALLPDSPSQPRDGTAGLPSFRTSRIQDRTQDSPYDATSPVRAFEHSRSSDNFSQPSAACHTAQSSPVSPSRHLTPDFFTFHHETPFDTMFEPQNSIGSPEPSDYPIGTWNDGIYDLASPHAVTTDDCADWNRQVPFSMVKTELAPVEEDDETDEKRSSFLACTQRPVSFNSGLRNSVPAAEHLQSGWAHPMPPAEESPSGWSARLLPVEADVFDSLQRHSMAPAKTSEPSIEDPLDDIPARPRLSRHISVGPNDMEAFWDIASDAINCSYALGAEGDSHFDWHRSSIHEDDITAPTVDDIQTAAVDTASASPNRKPQPASPSPSRHAAKRSSSVYSSSPPSLLPVQTFPSSLDPPSAGSTESSFSSIPEAVTPDEATESALATRFSAGNCKEWCRPTYVVADDFESQTVQDDLYHQIYTTDYPQDATFHLHNVGRIDGSTISNSPRSSRSLISKSNSQESFWCTQAASNARRPRNAGSVGSLPELMSSKNSRERIDPAVDQLTDNSTFLNLSDSPSESQQTLMAQRRRSPNLAKDAAQNIMLSKAKTAEEPVPLLPVSRDRAISDVSLPAQDPSMPPPFQPAAGRRMRSGSSASSLNARGSRGSYNVIQPPHTTPVRNP